MESHWAKTIKKSLRRNKLGGLISLDIKTYYKATIIKRTCTGTIGTRRQTKFIENPETNPCIHGHLIYDKNRTTQQV